MTQTKAEIFNYACQILEDQGYESDFREAYSGQGMFGKNVEAIVTDASGPIVGWAIIISLIEHGNDLEDIDQHSYDMIPKHKDQLGLNMVYY